MQLLWYGQTFHDTVRNSLCCLQKDESYSSRKGHCFAQLPSAAGAAPGVESQIDKSEVTLK